MSKRRYASPMLMTVTPGPDPDVHFGGSQGTTGEDPIYTWDPAIDPNNIDMFWASYDDTDLFGIDTNGDQYISKEEFDAWYSTERPW